MPYLEWSNIKLLQNTKTFLLLFILPSNRFSRQERTARSYKIATGDQNVKICLLSISLWTFPHQDIILTWFFSFLCQSAIYQRLKQKHDCKHEMKLKPCLNSTGLQWAVPSVTRSKWLKLMYYNVWSGRVTKTNKKGEKEKKKKREERSEGQSRGAVTFSSGGWRAPSLLVKEELFHPAITESLSPH